MIDFAPETVFEYTNTKVIFIFESNYSYENLKLLENNITIKLNSVYVSCKILSKSSLSFITPLLPVQDLFIDIYINGDRVCQSEISNNKLMIKIVKNNTNYRIVNIIFTLKGIK